MSDQSIQTELLELQRQLQQLELAKKKEASDAPQQQTASTEQPLPDWVSELAEIDKEAALEKLTQLTKSWLINLDNDLEAVKPSTILLILGLGVMLGKLTN
jgi:hypothetical protein